MYLDRAKKNIFKNIPTFVMQLKVSWFSLGVRHELVNEILQLFYNKKNIGSYERNAKLKADSNFNGYINLIYYWRVISKCRV